MSRKRAIFAERKRRRVAPWLVPPLTLLMVLAVVLALNLINNGRIRVEKVSVTVTGLSDALERFRILHISDLHGNEFGAGQSTLRDMLKGERYQAVCVTGDVCSPGGDYSAFLKLVDLFAGVCPVYFIAGDEDPQPLEGGESVKADYIVEAEARGAIYLDTPQRLAVGKSAVWFAPESLYSLDIDSSRATYQTRRAALLEAADTPERAQRLQLLDYQLAALDEAQNALTQMQPGDAQIALTHHPLTADTLATLVNWNEGEANGFLRGISLVLAGHYNAGQIRLPLLGALRAPASAGFARSGWLPGDEGLVGLSFLQGVTQYISPGLGVSSVYPLPVRLFNTPTVTVLTLTSALTF